jgi:hypothetical protein
MTTAASALPVAPGWLRGRGFDLGFIGGVALLALAAGLAAAFQPRLFPVLLFLDLWLLGYHHVISTYTRLCFDRQSLRENAFLVIALPPIVLCGVLLLVLGPGVWSVATLFFYWQWFHYTRQSYGVGKVYAKKAGETLPDDGRLTHAVLYVVPLWAILERSHQGPGAFLGLPLRTLPVPDLVLAASMCAALVVLGAWLASRAVAWWRGRLPLAHTLYVLSHVTIFWVGYVAIRDVSHGWLVLNVWHNAQYVLFVWLYNNKRFERGVASGARLLSSLSQTRNAPLYFAVCLAISTAVYLAIESLVASTVLLVVIYQTINFHHYVVDGQIWKVRRKSLQRTLGLARSSTA